MQAGRRHGRDLVPRPELRAFPTIQPVTPLMRARRAEMGARRELVPPVRTPKSQYPPPPPPPGAVEGCALVSMVMLPFGVFMVPLCTVQKNGTTVPFAAVEGSVKLFCPVKVPVSKEIPATAPAV